MQSCIAQITSLPEDTQAYTAVVAAWANQGQADKAKDAWIQEEAALTFRRFGTHCWETKGLPSDLTDGLSLADVRALIAWSYPPSPTRPQGQATKSFTNEALASEMRAQGTPLNRLTYNAPGLSLSRSPGVDKVRVPVAPATLLNSILYPGRLGVHDAADWML